MIPTCHVFVSWFSDIDLFDLPDLILYPVVTPTRNEINLKKCNTQRILQ